VNIFEEIAKLNFPPDQYIVVGSGIMAAKGIREAKDLDIIVTPELFEKCKAEDWELLPWTKEGIPGKEWLKKGPVELFVQLSLKAGGVPAKELLKNAEIINGIPFITLKQHMEFKAEFGRPQDFADIEMIKKYLATT
jgi:hypothetical protein